MSESVSAAPSANAARAYLVFFPLAHMFRISVGGAMGTGADLLALFLLVVWLGDVLVRRAGRGRLRAALSGTVTRGMPPRSFLVGLAVLAVFGLWVGLSGLWGFHGLYAGAKGAGTLSLVFVALALGTSGLGWRRAADAWLVGAGVTLAATALVWATGPAGARDAIAYYGGGVQGLPFPRVSGPFRHPNMFGDYLVVSAFLLFGRVDEWKGRARGAGVALGVALAVALALTASTALVGAGVAAAWLGWVLYTQGARFQGVATGVGGLAVAAGTAAAVMLPLNVQLLGVEVVGGGIRPAIWRSALQAVSESPFLGVGAAPYLARAADPLYGGAVGLWDAHNAYLSVLGQFGLVGGVLMALGIVLVLRGLWAGRPGHSPAGTRKRLALGLAVTAVAVNALFLASEDLRHLWALAGISPDLGLGAE